MSKQIQICFEMTLKLKFSLKIISKLFLYFALIATSSINPSHETKEKNSNATLFIHGGYRDPAHKFAKHIVSLRYGDDVGYFGINHFCGGSILSESVILTAAHCSMGATTLYTHIPEKVLVIAGTTNRLEKSEFTQIRKVRKVLPYPSYNRKLVKGDFGLMFLSEPLIEDGIHIQRIPLTTKKPQPGQECTTLGWGAILPFGPKPAELLYLKVTILNPKYCVANYIFTNGVICADVSDGRDAGVGDSGGPFICDGQLSGLVSYGTSEFLLGFYADAWYYRDWILENNALILSESSWFLWLLSFVRIALIN